MMAWLFWTAGTLLFAAQLVFAFVEVCDASFVATIYQDFLLYVAFAIFACFMNIFGFKAMPTLSKFMIGYINIGSLFVLIALLVRAHPKPTAQSVFVDVVDETGWDSKGLVFFLGLLPGITAINGFDCAAHMADELPNPARQVPQVMIGTVLLCGFAGLPMVIALLFSVVNADNLLAPVGGQAIFQLFVDSMDSFPLTVIACLIYLGLFAFASVSITTTLSRCWWSFARSGAIPGSQWQGHLSSHFSLPVNSIIVVVILEVLLGLLIFGPSTVLSGVIGSAAICFFLSYSIPILCFLIKGRDTVPSKRYFNLGAFGPWVNGISVLWALLASVFLCFPTYVPVTALTMNYASAVVGVGVVVWAANWVLFARKTYQIPQPLVQLDEVSSESSI
jgi:choline transport protein